MVTFKRSLFKFIIKTFLFIFFIGICLFTSCADKQPIEKPNIVFIIADDLGYGDLSCYGQDMFETPNIDKLSEHGMIFTQHYSGSTVCAPSRSVLMTGLHTGHTPVRGNQRYGDHGQYPLADSVITLPELLQQNGYVTGAFGKWGLGPVGSEGDPNNQGIDEFFGYNSQSLAHNYYPYFLWSNDQKIMLDENSGFRKELYAPELIQEKTLEFIERNKDNPFFLFVPTVIPHAELIAPEEVMEQFRGKYLPEKVYHGLDSGAEYRQGPYGSQTESHAAFVAMISILDQQVGEIMGKIDELGLREKTIIIFTSDNGPHLEGGGDPDYFDSNGPLKGYKRDLYEGGVRVPLIVSWPGKVEEGSESNHISAFWDFLPTFSEILDISEVPENDGISFLPELLGENDQKEHEYLYWEFHENGFDIAVRKGNWKGIYFKDEDQFELYNLEEDLSEENDIAGKHPEIVEELKRIMIKSRTPSPVFEE